MCWCHRGPAFAQTTVNYDLDNANYINVANLAQLNAIRYDLNGDGAQGTVNVSDWTNYTTAYPNATSKHGLRLYLHRLRTHRKP